MTKARLRSVTPNTVNRTVAPKRPPNKDLRTREHLTEAEVKQLIKAAQDNRYSHRDAAMVLVAYRHGLRAAAARPRFLIGATGLPLDKLRD
jgi:site-specific recombinase XerD